MRCMNHVACCLRFDMLTGVLGPTILYLLRKDSSYIHTYIHIYIHTHIYTYTHAYIHIYTHTAEKHKQTMEKLQGADKERAALVEQITCLEEKLNEQHEVKLYQSLYAC